MIARPALLCVLAGLMATAPALGVEVQGNALILSPSEQAACAEEGGCALVTRALWHRLIADAKAAGATEARVICGKTL